MSTHNDDEDDRDDHGTAIALALVGGGAVLLWWLLRGRGKGWRGFGRGSGVGGGYDGGGSLPRLPAISVRVVDGDRILLDGGPADLDTMLARARVSSQVHLTADGAARHGFVSNVLWTLLDADINVDADWDLKHRTARVGDPEGAVISAGKIFFFDNPTIDNCLRTRPRKECLPGNPHI
jgi:hypothetical protein